MKKILTLLAFAVILQFPAKAQFVHYGARIANGAAYVADDLLTHTPIFGFSIGGYVDYMFTEWKNPWAENIYLQTGLNITRRGTNFQQVFVNMLSIRQGFFHNWYAQIPIIAGFKYEIPQLPAGNYVNFFLGPTVNVGLFGRLWDRQVTPGMPQSSNNYDTFVTGSKSDRSSFKHQRRIDVGLVLGVGYQWHNFTFDLYMDHGFVALMKKDDVLAPFDQTQNQNNQNGNTTQNNTKPEDRNAYTGTNNAFMLAIGYQLPINR
ncbi:MAG: PorT family protein [Bacteroidales bacterium]|nr:PorT family protein [Bacteroidales bacterium]